MSAHRTAEERIRDARRMLEAANLVHAQRARLAPEIARTTGLSPAGVELGFESLERGATEEELRTLVARAGDAPHVHVILSANVFVAPLRALMVARAAAPRVTVRPSSRDPVLVRALVETVRALGDTAVAVDADREVSSVTDGEIHAYGRGETLAAIQAAARVRVRAHGPGLGLAVVVAAADVPGRASAAARAPLEAAAERLASDVVPFDQRGCLSPRIALVEGPPTRAAAFAALLHERLRDWGDRVPRGLLSRDENAEAARWIDAVTFAGECWTGRDHAVALAPAEGPPSVPPSGRHVLIVGAATLPEAFARIAPISPFVVAVGADDLARVAPFAPNARVLSLGRMQHPPLDGPVDLR